MPLTPVSRESMRMRKAEKDEETRLQHLNNYVSRIYSFATTAAETKDETVFKYPLPELDMREMMERNAVKAHRGQLAIPTPSQRSIHPFDFMIDNMAEILATLQSLFPGCSVEHTTLTMGQDGKMYDVSKMDEKLLPFINRQHSKEYIVIDWS